MNRKLVTAVIIICVFIVCVFLLRGLGITDNFNVRNPHEKVAGVIVTLDDKDSERTIPLGSEIQYSDGVHGSVGSDYRIEYDRNAFSLSSDKKYKDSESVAMGMCGGDRAVKTCRLRALKKGKFIVKVFHEFRGEIESVITYTIIVE